jgi:hypothetical protein
MKMVKLTGESPLAPICHCTGVQLHLSVAEGIDMVILQSGPYPVTIGYDDRARAGATSLSVLQICPSKSVVTCP